VAHEDHRHAPLAVQLAEEADEMPLMEEVEMARRLVQEEHSRLLGERAREQRALALSARERVDEVVAQLEDAGEAHRLPGPREVRRTLEEPPLAPREAPHEDQLLHAHRERELLLLGNDRNIPGQVEAGHRPERPPAEADLAPVRRVNLREESQQRGLPRAVGTHEPQDLALGDLERRACQAERPAVAELDGRRREHRRGRAHGARRRRRVRRR
jgi:hypothetical protein